MEVSTATKVKASRLRLEIARAEAQLNSLRTQLQELESSDSVATVPASEVKTATTTETGSASFIRSQNTSPSVRKWPLEEEEYTRYARQLILSGIGVSGQLHLKSAAVLIVGAGGLGCPAAAYLAGAGVGTLGVVDGDIVEVSNLHRQIAHSTSKVGQAKVDSLVTYCEDLNPGVNYVRHVTHLTSQNAVGIVSRYDVVLDCTDHPTSRYLISDTCVLMQKPLISASALRTDGQLIVLNNPAKPQGAQDGGPCYRCIFPRPPPPESVVSCGEGGILGPVVGVMGVMQALEAIKLIAVGISNHRADPGSPTLHLFSTAGLSTFRSMRMRGRRADCFACSTSSTLTVGMLQSGSLDYAQFCGVTHPVEILQPDQRISALAYQRLLTESPSFEHLLLDVREKEHFSLASLPGAINVPYSVILSQGTSLNPTSAEWMPKSLSPKVPIYVICRVGNDSQVVTQRLNELGFDEAGQRRILDIQGGMRAWKHDVDKSTPFA